MLIFNLSYEEPFPYPISTNVSTPSSFSNLDSSLDAVKDLQGCRGLFKGAVSRAVAQAIDRHLTPGSSTLNGSQSIGSGQSKVIMAVDRDMGLSYFLLQLLHQKLGGGRENAPPAVVIMEMVGPRVSRRSVHTLDHIQI